MDEVARLSSRLIAETMAILGRSYAESRELALLRAPGQTFLLYVVLYVDEVSVS